jgi:hypothetical protein
VDIPDPVVMVAEKVASPLKLGKTQNNFFSEAAKLPPKTSKAKLKISTNAFNSTGFKNEIETKLSMNTQDLMKHFRKVAEQKKTE